MTISTRARLLAGASLAFGLTTNAALAQTAQPSTAQPSELGEIVVTASGFEQRINQAPASISVIPAPRSRRCGPSPSPRS